MWPSGRDDVYLEFSHTRRRDREGNRTSASPPRPSSGRKQSSRNRRDATDNIQKASEIGGETRKEKKQQREKKTETATAERKNPGARSQNSELGGEGILTTDSWILREMVGEVGIETEIKTNEQPNQMTK